MASGRKYASFRHRSQRDNEVIIENTPLSAALCITPQHIFSLRGGFQCSYSSAGWSKWDIVHASCSRMTPVVQAVVLGMFMCRLVSHFMLVERSVIECFLVWTHPEPGSNHLAVMYGLTSSICKLYVCGLCLWLLWNRWILSFKRTFIFFIQDLFLWDFVPCINMFVRDKFVLCWAVTFSVLAWVCTPTPIRNIHHGMRKLNRLWANFFWSGSKYVLLSGKVLLF